MPLKMSTGYFQVPIAFNEPVQSYEPNSPEREEVLKTYDEMYHSFVDVPLKIDGKEVLTGDLGNMRPPHDHGHRLGTYHRASKEQVEAAIASCLRAKKQWEEFPWEHRAAIFLKAADLISGPYRARINAATMLGQSKTVHQAEIDAACELIDFLRFNVQYMTEIYGEQPESADGIWNRLEYRPLEGFTYAITPFNFTAIAGNLPTSMAMMGNTVIWKPSDSQVYSAKVIMDVLEEAGLPGGVINLVMGDPVLITETVFDHPEFAGLHFTGSTDVFKNLWAGIGRRIHQYKTYPRIVGETGGKDFIIAHPSAKPRQVATAIVRGAFEFQGQKCSAASRIYLSESQVDAIMAEVRKDLNSMQPPGSPADMKNFVTAVIHEGAFDRITSYIDRAKESPEAQIWAGGNSDKSKGYFIEPTLIMTTNPHYETMVEELFGPVATVYVYPDDQWDETLELLDSTSPYGLTGAVFSQDRYALEVAIRALRHSAGNFYINDKPTGAVVGQQPFGGARGSGTNDKAGSVLNLLRWVSPRLIKENFLSPESYRYPYMG